MTVDYETLRDRHRLARPLLCLQDDELTALVELTGTVRGPLRDMAFLAVCEKQTRAEAGIRRALPRKDLPNA